LRNAVYLLFLLSPVKFVFPVAYQFLEIREVGSIIPSGIDYFVRPAGIFEATLEVVEYALGYVNLKGLAPLFIFNSRREE
jgi:hypothetical protein